MLTPPQEAVLGPLAAGGPTRDRGTMPEERRASGRIRTNVATELIRMGGAGALRCLTTNIGAGGLFVHVPAESALAVGQRYEVVLPHDDAEAAELSRFVGDGCYATVVRTRPLMRGDSSTVGAGLRFDHPLVFWGSESI